MKILSIVVLLFLTVVSPAEALQGIDPDWLVPEGVVQPIDPALPLDAAITSALSKFHDVQLFGGSAPLAKTYVNGALNVTFSACNDGGGEDPYSVEVNQFDNFTDLNGKTVSALGLATASGDEVALNSEVITESLFKTEAGGNLPVDEAL